MAELTFAEGRVPKIVLIGAGSVVFTRTLLTDILSFPELRGSTLALVDIDPRRLETAEQMARLTAAQVGATGSIEATLDRKAALYGADYVINMIQVGMHQATLLDFQIPARYGLRQTIGDTLGVGGVFRALRTIPVVLDICRDMEAACPGAWLLNYTNPMAMLTWAVYAGSAVKVVGLCHSVQGTSRQLAGYVNAPYEEISYLCGGLNHMSWFLQFRRGGEDAYPAAAAGHAGPGHLRRATRCASRSSGGWATGSPSPASTWPSTCPTSSSTRTWCASLDIPIDEYVRRSEVNLRDL